MNTLVVLAHPEPRSFNAHLARVAQETLSAGGHGVRISDLYAADFDPRESPRHFANRHDPERFDVQAEQCFNWEGRSLAPEVESAIADVFWADLVILQFPLWWFGPPAMLKGWMDRVFVYGGLYSGSRRHNRGPCSGRRALMCVTTGSSAAACSYNGREGDTQLILWPSLYALRYVGFTVLEPFFIHGVRGDSTGEERVAHDRALQEQVAAYRRLLLDVPNAPTVAFNADADWDESGTLKPEAPVYSPFIRQQR